MLNLELLFFRLSTMSKLFFVDCFFTCLRLIFPYYFVYLGILYCILTLTVGALVMLKASYVSCLSEQALSYTAVEQIFGRSRVLPHSFPVDEIKLLSVGLVATWFWVLLGQVRVGLTGKTLWLFDTGLLCSALDILE